MSDNKLACSLFFAKTDPGDAECRDYKCKICSIVRKANKSGGYTNLIEHLKEKHPKWKDVVARAKANKPVRGAIDMFCKKIDGKYLNIHRWIVWVIKEKHPFTFVDRKYTRRYTKLESICKNTLLKYMSALYERVKVKIAAILPDTFGGIFDGWSCVREHYLAFFATWTSKDGIVKTRLLCCGVQDLPDEEQGENADDFGFSAADLGDYILNAALMRYGKSYEHLEFLAGDNCSVNKLLVELITVWYTNNGKPQRVVSNIIFITCI
jgi:hypothetical protein